MRRGAIAISSALLLSASTSVHAQTPGPTPTLADAQYIFLGRVKAIVQDVPFKLQSFEKTDGQRSVVNGVVMYRMSYKAVVSFPTGNHPECVQQGNRFPGWDCWRLFGPGGSARGMRKIPPTVQGAWWFSDGVLTFEKTERHWVAH